MNHTSCLSHHTAAGFPTRIAALRAFETRTELREARSSKPGARALLHTEFRVCLGDHRAPLESLPGRPEPERSSIRTAEHARMPRAGRQHPSYGLGRDARD